MNTKSSAKTVKDFLSTLDHPLKKEIEAVRKIILSANGNLTEQIKWNAPSFCYNGDDRITFNLRGVHSFKLIFHRGAKAKAPKTKGRLFEDESGLLEWAADDRAILTIGDMKDVKRKSDDLTEIVQKWIQHT